ncbi:DNA alkylation response protein [Rhodobacteraceae bacterium 2CG4]|uniref:DNA alkylation response protein n=1 Tax=Halovulum marinum TaxID=2662447 RepID=A0A6L5YY50_9RHOB|nr:acyl-CoA dehydrogenase family protein [Halovulum marinum]MSU89128.1 DNA alkylation response protein [Halovulum marinum]
MAELPGRRDLDTHAVENQPAAAAPDPWAQDAALRAHAGRQGGRNSVLQRAGAVLAAADIRHAAQEARRDRPRLVTHDRGGARLDEVRFHDGYHRLLHEGLGLGYAALPWDGAAGGHVTHAALVYLFSQLEPGVCCPMTMSYAAVPALAAAPELETIWRPRLISGLYEPAAMPVAAKRGVTLGMAMTEKQGGSDVRANTTRAEPDGDAYRLTGHKWFCSAPMSDGFLTLAQAPGGLTCFLVPRWLEDGRNRIHLLRLKDKLGNVANASAEIEYAGALAWRLGDEGAGVRTIIEMVHHTRLDTAMAPAGLMRAALAEAHGWATGRTAFGKRLIDQPLMRAVLADLALDWEGALALALRCARAFDDPGERALARIAVALAKFLNNKRCGPVIAEAMEALGGIGYVEETPLPMLYREAPLNGIWEGAGNVICLDILRTLARAPEAAAALDAELDAAGGADRAYDAGLKAHRARWPTMPDEAGARWFAESLATLLTASVLIRSAPAPVADGFVASRVAGQRGQIAGSVAGLDLAGILDRIAPPG